MKSIYETLLQLPEELKADAHYIIGLIDSISNTSPPNIEAIGSAYGQISNHVDTLHEFIKQSHIVLPVGTYRHAYQSLSSSLSGFGEITHAYVTARDYCYELWRGIAKSHAENSESRQSFFIDHSHKILLNCECGYITTHQVGNLGNVYCPKCMVRHSVSISIIRDPEADRSQK